MTDLLDLGRRSGSIFGRLRYRMSIFNGDPILADDEPMPTEEDELEDARVMELEQGGIAPKPSFFFPGPKTGSCTGSECTQPPVGCVGVECFDPGFANRPVRTLWTQDGID